MTVSTVRSNGVELAYEAFGAPGGVPVLLVMGLATQMLGWPDEFVERLAAPGRYVVRYDNRDIGLSTHLRDAPRPDLGAAFAGDYSSASYSIVDMADDAVGLLDALGLDSAHVVGVSMGGMISQQLAISSPHRVRSLTSIMSTPAPSVGPPTQEAAQALLRPAARTREEAVTGAVDTYKIIGSPSFPFDEAGVAERAGLSYDRAHDPGGVMRQLLAIQAGPDRRPGLAGVTVPTLVVHGTRDILVQPDGGEATAAAVPGSRLELVEGMGHDLPREVWPRLLDWIGQTIEAGEAAQAAA